MSWPLSQDYNEAIQEPRVNFEDAELKAGEAVANALGIPMPRSGNFADVYEVRCPSGARWAVKCFTREVHGLRERYAEISNYLRQANLPFMVDFQYLEQGIRVRGNWFPVLKMEWVEGFVLNEFIRDNLDKKPILQALSDIWLRMARRLRKAKLAHCDLQHGNVLLVPGSTANSLAVKLIDYDGMYVPSLAGKNSGEVGHPAYQHPERLRTRAYDPEVDRFSLLNIAASLRCLIVGGRSLWERYDNGDNLLFRQSDLQAPAESPLFQELLAIGDPQGQLLVTELFRACQGPLPAVPSLTDLIPEEPAIKVTKVMTRSATAQGPDWDFGDAEPGARIVRKRRKSAGMPLWAWCAAGGAAALLVSVGAALVPDLLRTEKSESTIARKNPAAEIPNPSQISPTSNSVDSPSHSTIDEKPAENDGHRGVFCLTPASDKLAISGGGEMDWRLIDPRSNRLLQRFTGHKGPINGIAFSADGSRAVTSSDDGTLRLWDAQTGESIDTHTMRGNRVVGIALSPDGSKVVTVEGSTDARLWDFEAKTSQGYRNTRDTTCVAFAPDGRQLIFGYDKADTEQEEILVLRPLAKGLGGHGFRKPSEAVSCIAASPNGKYLAAGHGGDTPLVTLWETATRRLLRQFAVSTGSIHQLAFSPDGRFLLVSASNHCDVWPVETAANGEVKRVVEVGDPTKDRILAAFTPDNTGVTFVYRKGDQVTLGPRVPLSSTATPASQTDTTGPKKVVRDPPVEVAKATPPRRPRRASNKPAVPNEQTLNEKRNLLQDMYSDDYKSKTKRALAAQFLQDVKRQGDRALSYAMLNEACDLASREGDLETALRAASELEGRFAFEPVEVKSRVLEQALSALPAKSKDKFRTLTQKALLFLDRAVIDEDFDLAEKLVEIARTAAAKADASTILAKTVNQQATHLKAILEGYSSIKRQAEKLDTDPDDPDANLALGRFRCFLRGDWDAGLPLLAKCSDKALSELAQNDLADPPSPAARAALGDGWWDRAEKLLGKEQDACRRRAYFWYLDCIDDLDAKGQTRVSSRLKKLTSLLSDATNPYPDLNIGAAAVSRKSGSSLLRLSPWQRIATRQLYRYPIDIRVTALMPKNHIRITFLNGGEVSLNPKDLRTTEVKYFGHYASDPDKEGGSWGPTLKSTPLQPNALHQIRILATQSNCTVWIDGKQVLSRGSSPPFTFFVPTPVRVWSDDNEVDVKSLVVRRVR